MLELRDRLRAQLGDSYTIERELTGGGMSRVFVALDASLGRRIVVKTLAPDHAGDVSADRFRREIQLAASLQQANIVPLLTAGEIDGVPYYTMPFIEGESLRTRLTAHGAHSVADTVGILRDVARALAFAHERGVVHRDIKPDNILLSGSTAVVTDFGIAKAIAAARTSPDATLTQAGLAVGTPAYVAPEQATGEPSIDHRVDLYAFGIMAYELLVGEPPFAGRSAQATIAAQVMEQPVPLRERRRDIPPGLATLVMRCLEKDPERRPATAREVLTALDFPLTPDSVASAIGAKPSIAVMPFANLSPDPADEFFADGLTDEIITDLSPIRGLHVIARAAMMRFKGTDKDPVMVAREVNVRYVLDGSVRRAGASLRLTARLIDAADGSTVWADKLGGSVEDVFAMQERVSRTIVDALAVVVSPREEQQLRKRPISDLRAYEYYLQARQSMWTFTVPALDRALRLLGAAQSRIGDNARVIASLGGVHLNYIETGQVDSARHLAAADECATKLATLDPDSFNLHYLRGWLQWRSGHIRESILSLSRARDLEPNSSDVLILLAYANILAGRDEPARECADAAVRLDPLTPLFQCMPGFCEIVAGRPGAAVAGYRYFLEVDPANPIAHLFLTWALCESGQHAEAQCIAEDLSRSFRATAFGHLGEAYAHGLRGDRYAALAVMTPDIRSLSRHSESIARIMASILTVLGDVEGAIDALEASVSLGNSHYPYLAREARVFDPLRYHPRFQTLLETVRGRWERGGTSAADLSPPSA